MAEGIYPKCEKCGEGTLLPFFLENGENFYKCTKCVYNFTKDGYA